MLRGEWLALGVTGALVLAARRRGSRAASRTGVRVEVLDDLSSYAEIDDIPPDTPLFRLSWPDGGVTLGVWDLRSALDPAMSLYSGGVAYLRSQLAPFPRWVASMRFPLVVWRGLRMGLGTPIDEHPEAHEHWTTNRKIALAFAEGRHWAASRSGGRRPVLLRGVVEDPGTLCWGCMLEDFVRFTGASYGDVRGQEQVSWNEPFPWEQVPLLRSR